MMRAINDARSGFVLSQHQQLELGGKSQNGARPFSVTLNRVKSLS